MNHGSSLNFLQMICNALGTIFSLLNKIFFLSSYFPALSYFQNGIFFSVKFEVDVVRSIFCLEKCLGVLN